MQALDRELADLAVASQRLEAECGQLAKQRAELAREKEMLLVKKETGERFQGAAARKKFFQEEVGKVQAQMAGVLKDREDA